MKRSRSNGSVFLERSKEAPQYQRNRKPEQRDRGVLEEREAMEGRVDGRSLGQRCDR